MLTKSVPAQQPALQRIPVESVPKSIFQLNLYQIIPDALLQLGLSDVQEPPIFDMSQCSMTSSAQNTKAVVLPDIRLAKFALP